MIERNWTEEEIDKLKKLFPFFRASEIGLLLDRTASSVYHKATRLGLHTDEDARKIFRKQRNREKSPSWKGGKKMSSGGHVLVLDKKHHRADTAGYVLEHIKVMEEHLGRELKENEVVHHKNGIKTDNRIENLEVMDRGEHSILHNRGRVVTEETRRKISETKRRKNEQRKFDRQIG